MRNLKVIMAYRGTAYHGFQRQENAVGIQNIIEEKLSAITNAPVKINGCSRTDTGVHANEYCFSFETEHRIPCNNIIRGMNSILPDDLAILNCEEAPEDFHARFDAKSREYCYFVHFRKDPFAEKFSYRLRYPLDMEAMNKAAELLLGEHDFSCFEKTGGNNATSICTISEAFWETYRPDHCKMLGYPCGEGEYIVFTIKADRFLRNMVRAIVGSLVEVGRGKKEPEWIKTLIADGTRSDAGSSVPGHALFFSGAEY